MTNIHGNLFVLFIANVFKDALRETDLLSFEDFEDAFFRTFIVLPSSETVLHY